MTGLLPGDYCWSVEASNNQHNSQNNKILRFKVQIPPQVSGTFQSSTYTCAGSGNVSGRHNSPDTNINTTNNPVTFKVRAIDPSGRGNIDQVRLLFAWDGDTTNTFVDSGAIEPTVNDDIGYVADLNGTDNAVFGYLHNGNQNGGATSGDLKNTLGTSTLLGLNQVVSTHVELIDANTIDVYFVVRIENSMASVNYGVYSTVISTQNGTSISSDKDKGSGGFVYRRLANWTVDNQAPSASVGNYQPTGPNTFSLKWTATDNRAVSSVDSYCYLPEGDQISITDNSYGTINLPNSEVQYPAASNCLVNGSNTGNHTYTLTQLPSSNIHFQIRVMDTSCNITANAATVSSPIPWIVTRNSAATANGGISGIKIQNTDLSSIVPNFSSESFPQAFFSEYALYIGTVNAPTRASKSGFIAAKYNNREVNTPSSSVTLSWYEYLKETISTSVTIQSLSVSNISGSVKSALANAGATKSAGRYIVDIPGNLTIGDASTTICDSNSIILVKGNLTVRPSLDKTLDGGCLFVVGGNVVIEPGGQVNSGSDFSTPALYDEINAMFVVDGQFRILEDSPAGNTKRDAIYIRGGVTSKTISFERNLGLGNSGTQPTEVFDYDPYYVLNFRDILSISEFSLREL